jgi:heat shock protein HslJ
MFGTRVSRARRAPVAGRSAAGVLVLVVLLAAAAGCAAPLAPGSPSTPGSPPSSVDRTFASTAVAEAGSPRPLVPGTRITLSVTSGGQLQASAGCNTLSGPVQVRRHRLVVGPLSSTDMGCARELHDQDEWLAGILAADPSYVLRGTRLLLTSGTTEIRLAEVPATGPDRPLVGTEWHLESLLDGDVVSPLPPGTGATLSFTESSVSVQVVDCNRGTGDVSIAPLTLEIGSLALTERACLPDPSAVEHAVVTALRGTVGYAVDGDALTLRQPAGAGLALRAGL